MSKTKGQIPRPIKRLYHGVRRRVLAPKPDRLFDVLYGDRLIVEKDNITLEFDTSSIIAKRWFYPRYRDGSIHEPAVTRALLELIDSDSIFFDVGANVGFYSVLGSRVCSEVHAFEMDPRLASIVSTHFDKRTPDGVDVHVVPTAVSEVSGEFVSFVPYQTDNPSTNTIATDESASTRSESRFQIQTLALDDYVTRMDVRPDIVKVDVEGFELSVLEGLSETIGGVRALLVEVHPELLERYGTDTGEVLRLLNEYGFSCRRFTDHRGTVCPEEALEPIDAGTNIDDNGMVLCTK